jgi:hypothetical protein
MFDPTIRSLPSRVPGGKFLRLGVTDSATVDRDYRELHELRNLGNFASDQRLILKIDVEGAEWRVIREVSLAELARYDQIVIELHDMKKLTDKKHADDVLIVLRKLLQTHIPFCLHPNNHASLFKADSYWFPDVLEVSYASREKYLPLHPATSATSDLQAPCNERLPEILLNGVCEVPPAGALGH